MMKWYGQLSVVLLGCEVDLRAKPECESLRLVCNVLLLKDDPVDMRKLLMREQLPS